jgi:hypothetical protein
MRLGRVTGVRQCTDGAWEIDVLWPTDTGPYETTVHLAHLDTWGKAGPWLGDRVALTVDGRVVPSPETEWMELGKRVATAPWFAWKPGMVILQSLGSDRVLDVATDTHGTVWLRTATDTSDDPDLDGGKTWGWCTASQQRPDLRDPATLGCILALRGLLPTDIEGLVEP